MSSMYYVSLEGDKHTGIADRCGNVVFKTYASVSEFMNHLRASPQWDRTVEIQEIPDKPDKATVRKNKVNKHVWINKFGSDHLRTAYNLGYPCEVSYRRERANHEGLRGYTIDFDNSMKTAPIDCPSVAAMAEINRLAYRYKPKAVMLISVRQSDDRFFTYPHREACVVMFMGCAFFKYVDGETN